MYDKSLVIEIIIASKETMHQSAKIYLKKIHVLNIIKINY